MLYYRIKKQFDQRPRCDGSILIGWELYTPAEMERYKIPVEVTEPVELKKSDVQFFFGARVEVDKVHWR